ncbi:MAG: methyltransferase domain-containing protein [Candidatus Bathyarchaeota archaeon]|nr:MAG: methyltransferase domain-containing protein [Candidatus Bathyarchaeota archaeon]
MSTFEDYLKNVEIRELLEDLGTSEIETLVKEIKHFTEKEAEGRDKILLAYFGEDGIERIVDSIVQGLFSPPKPRKNAKVLDVGAGSGFFTMKVFEKLRRQLPKAAFYAMDLTSAMLLVLARKTSEITSFLGLADNIKGSIENAREYLDIPEKFEALFSTLMLHHCVDVEKVFESFREVVDVNGKAVVIDLCSHSFEEFREEMGDVHLGFNPESIKKAAEKHFSKVNTRKILGIHCNSSGRSAELFMVVMTP